MRMCSCAGHKGTNIVSTDERTCALARLGYARVSTEDQTLGLQRDALRAAGCLDIYEEHASSKRQDRPALVQVLRALREGNVLVVGKFDRLGRSLRHLIESVEDLHQRGVGFQVLAGGACDTSTPHGRFAFQLFGALAGYAHARIVERVQAGLVAARALRR